MRIRLKIYKYMGELKRDFSSIEQAQQTAQLATVKFPDMIFEPEIELTDMLTIDLSGLGKDDTPEVNPWQNFNRH